MRRILRGLIIGVVATLLFVSPVLAIDNPETTSLGDVYVFEDVLETGDILVYVRYDVSYAVEPDEAAEDTFIMAIYGTDGTTLLFTRPLNYYQHNITSVYLSAAANTLVSGSAYYVRVMGSPALFELSEGVNMSTRVLVEGDYRTAIDLGGIMIAQAVILDADWGTTLLTASDRLNSTGSYYFRKAVPGLSTMAPEIFEVSTQALIFARTNFTHEGLNRTLSNRPVSLNSATSGLDDIFGITDHNWGQFGWWAFLGLVVASAVYAATRRPDIAVLGGFMGTMGVGAYMGLANGNMLQFVATVAIVILVIFAVNFFIPRYG